MIFVLISERVSEVCQTPGDPRHTS